MLVDVNIVLMCLLSIYLHLCFNFCLLVIFYYFIFVLISISYFIFFFFFSSRRRHTRFDCDWSSDVCSSDLWGIGLLTVLIPVAHFVLVPSFLAYGLWQFFQRLGTAELATDARGRCPDCGAEQALELAPRWRAPQPVTCRQCHRGLRLSLPA